MELKLFKVESADSGSVYTIRMDSSDPSITKFKSQLALFASITPQDQILLIGPPYKRLGDSQLGPQTEVPAVPQRIYLYNRQVLTGEQGLPASPQLAPFRVGLPDTDVDLSTSDVSALLEKASSPLLRALPDFERQFLRNLKRGEYYLNISDQIVTVCKKCVGEQGIQIDALQAALSNLQDHYACTKLAFESTQEKLFAQQEKHQALLDSFDDSLERLHLTPLHASLAKTVGGGEALYSIAHTGQNVMAISGANATHSLSTSPISPSIFGNRMRAHSIGDDENNARLSAATAQAGIGAALSPGSRSSTPVMQIIAPQQQQQQHQQQRKRDSFPGSQTPAGGLGLGLEVGSFEEQYPFQTGEIAVAREDYIPAQKITLYDCVPADKERAWAAQCGDVHKKVEEKLNQLLVVFRQVSAGLNSITPTVLDTTYFQAIFKNLESDLQLQKSAMSKLREDYQFVYDTLSQRASTLTCPAGGASSSGMGASSVRGSVNITDKQDSFTIAISNKSASEKSDVQSSGNNSAFLSPSAQPRLSSTSTDIPSLGTTDSINISMGDNSGANSVGAILMRPSSSSELIPSTNQASTGVDEDGDVMALLKSLESKRKFQETDVISHMMIRCDNMMVLKDSIASKKGDLIKTVFSSMKAIASVQTDIQFKLKKGLELMKKWHQGHNKYFIHLEHVAKLPESYQGLIDEIKRRHEFNKVFESRINSLSKDVSSLRAGEITFRESFIRTHGAHLPPIFFHMIPSLKDKPPYFDPRLTEAQWLPDVDKGPLDPIVCDPADDGGTAIVHNKATSDTDGVENVAMNSPVAVIDTASAKAPTSPASPSTPLNTINVPATQSATEKPLKADTEGPSSASPCASTSASPFATLKYQELETQNALLLKRIADLTAIVEKHGLSSPDNTSPTVTNDTALPSTSPSGSATRPSVAHVSPEKESSLPSRILSTTLSPVGTSSEAERSDRVTADTLTVMSRLRAIQGFLDSASIKTLLDTISITPSPENDPDTAWSALGMSLIPSPSRSSGSSGSGGGGERSDFVTGAGGEAGGRASETGSSESSACIEPLNREVRSDPVETLSLLERVTRALLGRIESQKALLERPQMTISYREFHVGSLALFMPLSPKMDVYLAFNSKCPHHYLSEESLHLIRSSDRRPPPRLDFIIGRVVFLEQLIAAPGNPYSLAPGSKYHLLHVEEIEPSRSSSGAASSSSKSAGAFSSGPKTPTTPGASPGPFTSTKK